jgi:hypothetical protein
MTLAFVPAAAHAAASVPGERLVLSRSSTGAVISDSAAAGAKALKIWSNGAASRSMTQVDASSRIVVRVRGEQCSGAPQMAVAVDGKRVLTSFVSATTYKDHVATVALAAGAHTVKVAFLNDLMSTCDRNLIVDNVTLAPALLPIVTPTPTPTPTATPVPISTPTPITGSVLWNGDTSTGNFSQYAAVQTCTPDRAQVVADPLGVARKVIKMTVLDSDVAPCTPTDNPRGQVLSPSILREGGEYWVGWSVLVPQSFPTTTTSGDNWISLGSIYGPPFAGNSSNGMKMDTTAGVNKFYYRRGSDYGYDEPWSMPLIRGRWVDFVYHLKMSRDGTVGFREQWVNTGAGFVQQLLKGQKRLYMKTMTAANDAGPNFSKVSVYYKRGIMSSAMMYFADHKIGTSFGAVAPRSYAG